MSDTHSVAQFQPESVIGIKSVFLLFIERIFVGCIAGIAGCVKKNTTKEVNGKQNDG